MRRWALFLLLFLAGLAVLWWVDRGRRRVPRQETDTSQSGQPGQGKLTPVPLGPKQSGAGAIEGPFADSKFDPASGKPLYRITALDTEPLGEGVYRFEKVVARFFVPGSDQVRLEIRADNARGRLRFTPPPEMAPELDPAYPIELEGVVATLFEGSPFVPLTVRVPRATASIGEQTIRSADRVDIAGTGLGANGVGLSFDGKAKELRLERETRASLTLEDGTPAALSAAGGISFTSLEKLGEGPSRVVAREKAHLAFEGERPLVVDADTIELDALVARTPTTRVTPTRVSAHGSVLIAPVDGRFFGDDAELAIGPEGRPTRATLLGSPRVELLLRGVDPGDVPGGVGQAPADLEVRMVGAGPLEVQLEGDAHFDFRGPATLMLPALEMDLMAQERLSGTRQGDSPFARLDALGKVEAHWAGSTLSSEALFIERKLTRDGQIAAGLTSPGPTRAVGPLEDGGTFDLTAKGGLEFVRLANTFQVPLAREVDLSVTGPDRFVARAAELRDLDGLTRAFVGVGDVVFDSVKGRARGERIVARGKDSAELFGAPSAPAHCDLEQGWLEAHSILFDGDRLRADGDARAVVGLEQTRYDLAARWISLVRTAAGTGQELLLEAGGDVVAHIAEGERKLDLTAGSLEARASSPGQKLERLQGQGLVATGGVSFHASGEQELSGEGDRLVIAADRSGSLHPAEGGRVELRGRLPKDELSFEMTSGVVSFARASMTAANPVIEIKGVDLPLGESEAGGEFPLHAIAGSMSVDKSSILFTDGVYLGQSATQATAWSLDSEKLVLLGNATAVPGEPDPRFTVSTILAWGGFQAAFAENIQARGSTLLLDHDRRRLTLRGAPAELDSEGQRLSTGWLELELDSGFVRTEKGSWIPLDERHGAYEISFESMEPLYGIDSRIQVVREFRYTDHKRRRQTSAAWALFWLDAVRLERMTAKLIPGTEAALLEIPQSTAPAPRKRNVLMDRFLAIGLTDWVKEVYFEGNIEVLVRGERIARADAMYASLVDGHAWVRDLDVAMENPIRAEVKQLRMHADWLRCSADGSAAAENAVVTSCEFDEPHYEVTLGKLNMKPRPTEKARKAIEAGRVEGADETEGYSVTSRKNGLRLGKSPTIPLGSFSFLMNEDFTIDPESLSFFNLPLLTIGSSARYGFAVGLSIALPLDWLSKTFGRVLGKPTKQGGVAAPENISQHTVATVKFLSSRGLLVGAENRVSQKGVFKLSTALDVIYDTGSDRGLVRVPTGDRDSLRAWLHAEGRRLLGDQEWIDIYVTKQTDPGVQAEFFESDFIRWEQRETYLHWRKARGLDYSRATVEAQLDDHRREVVELPSVGYTRARAGVVRWWGRDLVYSSDTTAGYLLRLDGDPAIEDPFGTLILDGFGEEQVLRMDTTHRWELPMPLGILDARLVPFVEARATVWDRSASGREPPTRMGLFAGAEASTTFWRLYGDGDMHSLTPTLGFRGDLHVEESGQAPAQFDGVEDPLDGNFVDLGLRSRWVKPRDLFQPETEERFLDIEVRETYASDLSGGREEGWLPLRVNAQWLSEAFDVPFGVTHDARYDLDERDADYSRTLFALRPVPSVEIQTGYHSARTLAGGTLYSAWSLAARYTFSPKWQFEGNETVSSQSGNQLSSGLKLRRVGHDFVFELQYSFTAGEGGSSVGFALIPMLGYRERRFGMLSSWQREGN